MKIIVSAVTLQQIVCTGYSNMTFPEVSTPRLHLREPRMEDAELFEKIFSDPSLRRHSNMPSVMSHADVQIWTHWLCHAFRTKTSCAWTIELRSTHQSIGSIRFNRIDHAIRTGEVGFELLQDVRGKGYMTEALRAVIGIGQFRFDLSSLIASCAIENDSSQKVLQACGFRRELGRQILMGADHDRKRFDLYRLDLKSSALDQHRSVLSCR